MIKKIKIVQDSNVINDVDISRTPDFRGNQIEPNNSFTIFSNSRSPQYRESSDTSFNPQKKYIIKTNNRRKRAYPQLLNLYEYNGLDYIPSRDIDFKEDKQYYIANNNSYIEATPRNCKLEEEMAPLYSYYDVAYIGVDPSIQILHFDGSDFDKAKEAFEWCVQNTEEINSIYQEAKDLGINPKEAIIDYIDSNTDYVSERTSSNYTVRTNTAQRTTATRRSNRTATPFGIPEVVNAVLEKHNMTYNEIDPKENTNMTPEQKKVQQEAFGYTIYYDNGKYRINPLREPNTILGRHILNLPKFKKEWYEAPTIQELLTKVKKLTQILQDFKDNKINREDMLKKLNVTDSVNFITYEVKDGKKVITGAYSTLKEAQLADDEKLLPKYASLGIYKDESDNKFLVKPKDANGNLIRIGKFDTLLTAQNAAMAFIRANKDINAFFESDFYKDHIEECKEAYDYYKKDYSTEAKEEDPYIVKNENGNYDVKYKKDGTEYTIASEIPLEARAQVIVNEAIKSGDVEKYTSKLQSAAAKVSNALSTSPVESNPQTYAVNKNLGNVIFNIVKDIPILDVYEALSGHKEEHGKIYLKAIELLKKKLAEANYAPEAVELFANDYGNQFDFQKALEKRATEDLINRSIDAIIERQVQLEMNEAIDMDRFVDQASIWIRQNMPFMRHTYDKDNSQLKKAISRKYLDYVRKFKNR